MTVALDDSASVANAGEGEVILEAEGLSVCFGDARVVDKVDLQVRRGETFAVVGESGCGKSTLASALLALVPEPGRIVAGDVRLRGRSLLEMSSEQLRRSRGRGIAIVFQAAMSGFNPVLTIGRQVAHIAEAHPDGISVAAAEAEFRQLLGLVRVPADLVVDSFESQLSGGMRQRVAIAVALLLKPAVLVLDEPTTALDVVNQRMVIEVLRDLREETGVTIVLVTHDLGIVAELADRVGVMYAARLVEVTSATELFSGSRRHPYAGALMEAIPRPFDDAQAVRGIPGVVPSLLDPPTGCRFHPRCALAEHRCQTTEPKLLFDDSGHGLACHVLNEAFANAKKERDPG